MKRPLVGIETDIAVSETTGRRFARVNETYYQAVAAAGARPILLPPLASEEHVRDALELCDALVFTGGNDIPPGEYGQPALECPRFQPVDETRYRFGIELVRAAVRARKPLLGVCYGHQLLNVVLGGDIVQDIPMQVPRALEHRSSGGRDEEHEVEVEGCSRLGELLGAARVRVNSAHHQSVRRAGDGLRVVARSPDGVIEAVESDGASFLVGVQWHPERMGPGRAGWGLFEALAEAARHS